MKPVGEKTISGGSKIKIYPSSKDGRLKFVLVDVTQNYPEKGFAVNREKVEGVFVIEGELIIRVGRKTYKLKCGNIIYFEENQPYTVSGKGKVIVAISPAEKGETEIIEK